jgi:hypothetical protein
LGRLSGVLPEAHDVALAVGEVGGKAHVADRHLLGDGAPAVLRSTAARVASMSSTCKVMTGELTGVCRCRIPPPM